MTEIIIVETHPLLEALERLKLPAGDCPAHVQVVPLSAVKRLVNPPPPADSGGGEPD